MKHLRALLTVQIVLAICALVGSAASSATAATTSSVAALRICTGCAASAGDLSRYGYVILHSHEYGRIPAIKAASPATKVLLYKNVSATYSWAQQDGQDWSSLPAGVGYVDADRNHPEWFLQDTDGQRIEFSDYPGHWLMDIGNPDYQSAWLANVLADAKAHGWDGVMLDDVNASQWIHLGGRTIEKYPGRAEQTAAMRSFLARVGPGLRAQGLLAMPNVFVEWPDGYDVWTDWLQFTSGAVHEYWTKWGTGTTQHFVGNDWTYRAGYLKLTQRAGKIYLGITYAPRDDVRSMRYARASFLLDWDGGPSTLAFEPGAVDPWNPEWTSDIGTPLGSSFQVGSAWRRTYSGGAVLVNPATTSQTVSLGGTYLMPDGARVTSVTLGAATGLVLRTATTATTSTTAADTIAPSIAITSPGDGASVPTRTTIKADAADPGGIASVTFRVDGSTVCVDSSAPYSCAVKLRKGWRTVTAEGRDLAGNRRAVSIKVRST